MSYTQSVEGERHSQEKERGRVRMRRETHSGEGDGHSRGKERDTVGRKRGL